MKIAVIIQARTSSTRLPKKVLKPLPYNSNITVLEQVIRRLKHSKIIDEIIIATTTDKQDNEIINISNKEKVKCFKGSMNNVLQRYYLAAKENNIDIIVRVTSDCPCIDSNIIDWMLNEHLKNNVDYTYQNKKNEFPLGLCPEIINFSALEKAYLNAKEDYEKEHVTPYIYLTKPNDFNLLFLKTPKKYNAPNIRITLDTEEDYILLCAIYDYLYENDNFFRTEQIINLFNEKSWLKLITKKIINKKIKNTKKKELIEGIKILELQGLISAAEILKNQNQINFS